MSFFLMLKKQKKHKKHRHGSSYSSSSSSSTGRKRRGDRKNKKSKKDRSRSNDRNKSQASNLGVSEEERRELHELRRQAEIRRIRDEVAADLTGKKEYPEEKVQSLTPKTRKVVAAEARLLTGDGVVQIVKEDAGTWQEVAEQLTAQALPTTKNLLRQLRGNDEKPIPRGKAEVVRDIMAELQRKLE